MGAAVSTARSIGEAYTALTRPSPARRSATRQACSRPSGARCSPGARPGSTDPVVGVCPWRTNSTKQTGGAAASEAGLAAPLAWLVVMVTANVASSLVESPGQRLPAAPLDLASAFLPSRDLSPLARRRRLQFVGPPTTEKGP